MIDDEEFIRGNVPMTKREVRALTLAEARLDSDSIVVDVGGRFTVFCEVGLSTAAVTQVLVPLRLRRH